MSQVPQLSEHLWLQIRFQGEVRQLRHSVGDGVAGGGGEYGRRRVSTAQILR